MRTKQSASPGGKSAPSSKGLAKLDRKKSRRRKSNRRAAERSASVMVALDNPNGIRWVLEYAPIYAAILHGIETGLSLLNRQMQVCSIPSPEEFECLVRSGPPGGFLFLASKNVVALKNIIGTIPCVSVLGNPCDGLFDRVTYDNHATGRLPAELFLKNGITHAAILGPTEPGRLTTFGLRLSSFAGTMADGGGTVLSLISPDLYEPLNPSNQPRPEEVCRLISILKVSRPFPKALFVMADNLLPAVYSQLAAAGISPGKDIQVVSCNPESPYFKSISPEPALVDIPAEEIGLRGVDLLLWRTANPDRRTSTVVFSPSVHIPAGCPLCL